MIELQKEREDFKEAHKNLYAQYLEEDYGFHESHGVFLFLEEAIHTDWLLWKARAEKAAEKEKELKSECNKRIIIRDDLVENKNILINKLRVEQKEREHKIERLQEENERLKAELEQLKEAYQYQVNLNIGKNLMTEERAREILKVDDLNYLDLSLYSLDKLEALVFIMKRKVSDDTNN